MLFRSSGVLEEVSRLRSQWAGAKGDAKVEAANQLEGAIGRLMVVVEKYPDLKANQSFLALQDELAGTENRIGAKQAEATGGASCGVKEGEQISVGELLYGLLMPSGNDAGVALAEHFQSRFAPPEPWQPKALSEPANATRAAFVAEMNRTAQRLGLTHTVYRSPFGDGGTTEEMTPTAGDLAKLAWHALNAALDGGSETATSEGGAP